MKASIIICTRNRAESLDGTLASLNSLVVPPGLSAEVLVVNNASTDATQQVANRHAASKIPVRHVLELGVGQSRARNTGMRQSNSEIIIFTDDDVRPSPCWLGELCAPLCSGAAEGVAGRVTIPPTLRRPWMTPLHRSMLASSEDSPAESVEGLVGANMAFTRGVLEKVPAFDAELGPGALGFWDEALFSRQLLKAGYRLCRASAASVEHHFEPNRLSHESLLDRARREGRSIGYVAWHWSHDRLSNPLKLAWRKRMRLWLLRSLHRSEVARNEGCAEWEMGLVQQVNYCLQYMKESKRPRAYEKHGLRKLNGG